MLCNHCLHAGFTTVHFQKASAALFVWHAKFSPADALHLHHVSASWSERFVFLFECPRETFHTHPPVKNLNVPVPTSSLSHVFEEKKKTMTVIFISSLFIFTCLLLENILKYFPPWSLRSNLLLRALTRVLLSTATRAVWVIIGVLAPPSARICKKKCAAHSHRWEWGVKKCLQGKPATGIFLFIDL